MEQKRVYKVVLTGGPCGGKTTGQTRLCTFFENMGWKVFRVPETATVLLSGGIKFSDLTEEEVRIQNRRKVWRKSHTIALDRMETGRNEFIVDKRSTTRNWSMTEECQAKWPELLKVSSGEGFKFQENLLKTMIQIENTFFQLGESCSRNCLIICDRGAMDASAFISKEKWELMMSRNGWHNVELRDNRYNQIIHMVSAANGAEEFYSTEDHACRSEGMELARELDYKAAAAWVGHPYFDVIDNSQDFESKICRMIECICQKLGIDTGDRLRASSRKVKFLIKGPLPPDSEFPPFQDFDVVHNYLQSKTKNLQARLRKRGQKDHWSYIHTLRKPKMCGQVVEVKTQLTHRDYSNMLAQRDDSHFTIYKRRRCFLINNQYFQLDIYREPAHPRCKGLMLLETYTALYDDDLKHILPNFLYVEKDVTGNPDYSMFNLSLRGEWNTTDSKYCHNLTNRVQGSSIDFTDNQSSAENILKKAQVNGINGKAVNGTDKKNRHHQNCALSDMNGSKQNGVCSPKKRQEPVNGDCTNGRLVSDMNGIKQNGVHSPKI